MQLFLSEVTTNSLTIN